MRGLLKDTHSSADPTMLDLYSQLVRDFLSNLLTELLTLTWLIWTLRKCVVDPNPLPQLLTLTWWILSLRLCVMLSQIYLLNC